MNCKPGDLAVLINPLICPSAAGAIMEVVRLAPKGAFVLPDGVGAWNDDEQPAWVVRLVNGPIRARLLNEDTRMADYVVVADRYIRPLRGDPDVEARHEAREVTA